MSGYTKQSIFYGGTQIGWLSSNTKKLHLFDPRHKNNVMEYLQEIGALPQPKPTSPRREVRASRREQKASRKTVPEVTSEAEFLHETAEEPPTPGTDYKGLDEIFGKAFTLPQAVIPMKLDEYDPAIQYIKKLKEVEDKENYKPSKFMLFLGAYVISPEGKAWYKGIKGERQMARRLHQLREKGYLVLHAVPLANEDKDVDHLIVSPTGAVYSIDSQNLWKKTVWVSGARFHITGVNQELIFENEKRARLVADRLEDLTEEPTVTPIISVINASKLTVAKQPSIVRVIEGSNIAVQIHKTEQMRVAKHESNTFSREALIDPRFWLDSSYVPYPQEELLAWYKTIERRQHAANQNRTIFALSTIIVALSAGIWISGLFEGWW